MPADLPRCEPSVLRRARGQAGLTQRAMPLALGSLEANTCRREWPAAVVRATRSSLHCRCSEATGRCARPWETTYTALCPRARLSLPPAASAVKVSVRTMFRRESEEYAHILPEGVPEGVAHAFNVPSSTVEIAVRRGKTGRPAVLVRP